MGFKFSGPAVDLDQLDEIQEEATEAAHHLHNWERWFGLATVPNLPTHAGDRIGTTILPYIMDGGNNTWGNWLQILGSSDTPADAGEILFDLHRIEITTVERTNATHFIQIAFGASGAAGLAAGNYTEFVFRPTTTQGRASPIALLCRRIAVNTLGWARVWVVGQNTGTVEFWIGLHEYDE